MGRIQAGNPTMNSATVCSSCCSPSPIFNTTLTLRASSAASNSSWQVLSSTRLKVMGLVSPSAGGKLGSSLPRSEHRSAYLCVWGGSSNSSKADSQPLARNTNA
jgi:hypothetical protein